MVSLNEKQRRTFVLTNEHLMVYESGVLEDLLDKSFGRVLEP